MRSLSVLQPFVAEEPSDFSALAASCGKIIDAWLAEGGEGTDDEVVGFYSLWSQSLDARDKDESEFFRWAYPFFVQHRDEMRRLLAQS